MRHGKRPVPDLTMRSSLAGEAFPAARELESALETPADPGAAEIGRAHV